MKKYLLGIDVGTTGTKTYLFSESGEEIANAYCGYETYTPDTRTCEQDANELWGAVVKTVRKVCEGFENIEDIAAISMSTQGGTFVPTDENFEPVYNALVWSDKSCVAEREKFVAEGGDLGDLHKKTGWNLSYGLPLLQSRRFHDDKPEIFEKIKWFLSVPDFISAKMTGIPAVDMSNAGINELTDIEAGKYDDFLCGFSKIKKEQLPKLIKSCEVVGNLTEKAAEELGLSTKTLLVGGAHDQYAVALGAGINDDGQMLIGSGTSWVVISMGSAPDFESGLSQSVAAAEGKWGSLLSLSYGGACVEWLRKNVMIGEDGEPISLKELDKKCADARAASDGLMFYPFAGKLSDKNASSNTRAAFVGLDISHNKYDMALAVMEGVAFQIKWMSQSFSTEISKDGIKLTGGATKSVFWSQIIADVFNIPVIIPSVADMACVGAAIMAGVGAGVYENAEEGYQKMMQSESKIFPNPERAALYAETFEKYKHNAELISKFN